MHTLSETRLSIGSDTVARGLEWLDSAGSAAGWPQRTRFKLRLCLDEALTNITMYGFRDAAAQIAPGIHLKLDQEGERIRLEIADNGTPFDPTAKAPRALDATFDEARIGGHGLRLMQHYLDNMHYEYRDGWNRLVLAARLDAEA